MNKWTSLFLFCLLLISCRGKKTTVSFQDSLKPFELPSVPSMIVDPGERANYVALHFWDNFDVSDTLYLSNYEIIDQAFADFVGMLNYTDTLVAKKSITTFLNQVKTERMRKEWLKISEHYLYNPNSPLRNEDLFEYFLTWQVNTKELEESEKVRPEALLDLVRRNKEGSKATDFDFLDVNGVQSSLYKIKAPYVLVYFYDPDCHRCKEITTLLSENELLNEKIRTKEIVVLAVFAEKEFELWEKNVSSMPNNWLISYNKSRCLIEKELYDLKATPTMYLLDKEKKVLIKDATVEQIVYFISYK